MKNIFTSFAKSVLVALGLTTAALAAETSIQKKGFWVQPPSFRLSKAIKINNFKQENG